MPTPSQPVDFSQTIDFATFAGKTAFVTGGASGIGAGVVQALASHGAFVVIADLNASAGEAYVSKLKEQGNQQVHEPYQSME